MFCNNYESFKDALEKRGFTVHSAENKDEAREIVLNLVGDAKAGFGGSVTIKELEIKEALDSRGNITNSHNGVLDKTEAELQRRLAKEADYYICSTNAITKDGKLVNIDGMGNRVSAMIYGPKNVILVVGKNKLTNNIDEAIERIHTVSCPKNAARLNRDLPCRETGKCQDCDSPFRMCNAITILEHKTTGIASFHIVLVDEELGY